MSVYYSFKTNPKNLSRVPLRKPKIEVLDLKKVIVKTHKIPPNTLNLLVTNALTGEKYRDDSFEIPSGTILLVHRFPVGRYDSPAFGLRGTMPTEEENYPDSVAAEFLTNTAGNEERELNAIMTEEYQRVGADRRGRREITESTPLPAGYICHRCGHPGHHINFCPYNDHAFNAPPPPRPTTGVPKRMPREPIKLEDTGEYVHPDRQVQMLDPREETAPKVELCKLCTDVLKEPMLTNCCFTSFCRKCIQKHLDRHTRCPVCKMRVKFSDLRTR